MDGYNGISPEQARKNYYDYWKDEMNQRAKDEKSYLKFCKKMSIEPDPIMLGKFHQFAKRK